MPSTSPNLSPLPLASPVPSCAKSDGGFISLASSIIPDLAGVVESPVRAIGDRPLRPAGPANPTPPRGRGLNIAGERRPSGVLAAGFFVLDM